MKNMQIVLAGIVVIALLCSVGTVTALDNNLPGSHASEGVSDTIGPYNDPIGADSPLYDLKIAMEDLDETFTFNDSQRVEKQIDHGKNRIAEVQRELQLNRPEIAEKALEQYKQKLNMTEESLVPLSANTTGLLHAQEMITRHQEVLANLILQYPNNTGLSQAYDNSRSLELKFEDKTAMRFTRSIERDNKTVYKAVRLQIQNHNNDNNSNDIKNTEQEKTRKQEKITEQKDEKGTNINITSQNIRRDDTPSGSESHGNDSKASQDQDKKGRD
jgi:Domain of unknown function (DUF5667)